MSNNDSDLNSSITLHEHESQALNETGDCLNHTEKYDHDGNDSESVTYTSMPTLEWMDSDSDDDNYDDSIIPTLIYPSDDDDHDDDEDNFFDQGDWFPHYQIMPHYPLMDDDGGSSVNQHFYRNHYFVGRTRQHGENNPTQQHFFLEYTQYVIYVEDGPMMYMRNNWGGTPYHDDHYIRIPPGIVERDQIQAPLHLPRVIPTDSFYETNTNHNGGTKNSHARILLYPVGNGSLIQPQIHNSDNNPIKEEQEVCSENDDDG